MKPRWASSEIRTLDDLGLLLEPGSVLLLEGTRKVPESDQPKLVAMGRLLADRFPDIIFRSGNADGSDTLFAEGVCSVDPERMEYVVPHEGCRKKYRDPRGVCVALEQIPAVAEAKIEACTSEVSPHKASRVKYFHEHGRKGRVGAAAAYILRDTLKVLGADSLAPATVGLFYVNTIAPLKGGTGHTIRVCMKQRVPVVIQNVWFNWL